MRRSQGVWSWCGVTMVVGLFGLSACLNEAPREPELITAAMSLDEEDALERLVDQCLLSSPQANDFGQCVACCQLINDSVMANSCVADRGCCGGGQLELASELYATHCSGGGGGAHGPPKGGCQDSDLGCGGGGDRPPRIIRR